MGLTWGTLGPPKGADSISEGSLVGDSAFPWGRQGPGHISPGAEAAASGTSRMNSSDPGSLTDVLWGEKETRWGRCPPGVEQLLGGGPVLEVKVARNLGVVGPNSGELVHWTQ